MGEVREKEGGGEGREGVWKKEFTRHNTIYSLRQEIQPMTF